MLSKFLQSALDYYKSEKDIYDTLLKYMEKNTATRKYADVCEENGWNFVIDHLTIRTYDIDIAARRIEKLGWKYDETLDYRSEGWWAKVYRHPKYSPFFVDQSYDDVSDSQKIIKKWVDKFGDKDFHHIAVLLSQGVEIEEVINLLKAKGVNFPGKVTGPKETRLRQIFTQAEVIDSFPFSVLELAQRNKDLKTGQVYKGFIHEQADSLMKDSIL